MGIFDIDSGADNHLLNEQFHVFSKSPASVATALGDASNRSGHTVTASDVWGQEIPAFFYAKTQAVADTYKALAKTNDLCRIGNSVAIFENGNWVVKYNSYTDIPDGHKFKNANGDEVIRFHKNRLAYNLNLDNNAADDGLDTTAKIQGWDEENGKVYDYVATAPKFVTQFVTSTDKIVDGIPSKGFGPFVMAGTTTGDITKVLPEGTSDQNHYIANSFAGIIQFNKSRTDAIYVHAFEYCGKTLKSAYSDIVELEDKLSKISVTASGGVQAVSDAAKAAGLEIDSVVVDGVTTPTLDLTTATITDGVFASTTGNKAKLVTAADVESYVSTNAKVSVNEVEAKKVTVSSGSQTGDLVQIVVTNDKTKAENGEIDVKLSAQIEAAQWDEVTQSFKNPDAVLVAGVAQTVINNTIINQITEVVGPIEGTEKPTIADAIKKGITDATATVTDGEIVSDGLVKASDASAITDKAVAAAKSELSASIEALATSGFSREIVTELPTTGIKLNAIYLVKNANSEAGEYIEYIYVGELGEGGTGSADNFEQIGSTKTDLSGYATVDTVNTLAERVTDLDAATTGRVAVVEGKVSTLIDETVPAVQQSVTDLTKTVDDNKTAIENALADAKTEIGQTTSGLDTRLQTAEGKVKTLEETTVPALEQAIADGVADAKSHAESKASAAEAAAKSEAATNLATARTEITAEIEAAKQAAISSSTVTISQSTTDTGILVSPNGTAANEFTIGVDKSIIATVAALTAVADTVASNKTELEGKITAAQTAASEALEAAKTEIKVTTDALDSRLTDAEAGIEALTSGDNSVAKQIETAVSAAQTTLQGNIDGVASRVTTVEGKVSAIETDLSTGATAQAITKAQTDATQALADAAAAKTAGESAASAAQAAVEAKSLASTSTGSDLVTVTTAGTVGTGMTTTVDTTALATAISDAKDAAISAAATAAKAMTLSATDTDDAGKVTVTLGGTVETPTLTVTTSDIASAQTLSDLVNTVNTHIAEAAGLYLSVEKVDTLPADADAKTNKIYLVPLDTEAGRAQNVHTEYIWTNNKWEIIGTTAIDINSLEAAAEAAQTAADKAQGEVDALETVVETLTQTHATDKAALEASIATKTSSVAAGTSDALTGLSVTVDTDETSKAVTVSVDNSAVKGGSIPATAKVVANGLIDGTDAIATEKIAFTESDDVATIQAFVPADAQLTTWVGDMPNLESGYEMFGGCDTLETFIGDLSALTDGTSMFHGCTSLTTFIGDLSSLTDGENMFLDCKLSTETALEIVETLPTFLTGTHIITISVVDGSLSRLDEIAELAESKGWEADLRID